MTSRNLSEVFVKMRHNAFKNRNLYSDEQRHSDSEQLLKHSIHDAEEGMMEMRDDFGSPPVWLDKLEEAQYTISKIKPKLDELGSLHARHLLRPTFDENTEEEDDIDALSQEISKLITSTHRHIQCIRSSLGVGSKLEQRLTNNVVVCLLLQLQDLTTKFRNSQNGYLRQLSSREERSQKYFETGDFTNVDLTSGGNGGRTDNFVDTFDNFLQPTATITTTTTTMRSNKSGNLDSAAKNTYLFGDEDSANSASAIADDEQIDAHFQRPVGQRVTQQQLLLFEEENTRLAAHREQEVSKIVKSIYDLNDIFKDLGNMVQEQGTVLDRIDYNVEQTQTRVSEGLRQLHRADMYQRKNRKICVIMVLAAVTFLMLLLLIITKL